MSDTVLHLNGTAWKKPNGYESWLAYLYARTGSTSIRCATMGCEALADVGAHVKLLDVGDDRHWIIPACYHCNAQRGCYMEIRETSPRVLANQREEEREDWGDEDAVLSSIAGAVGVGVVVAGLGLIAWGLYEAFRSPPPTTPPQVPPPQV